MVCIVDAGEILASAIIVPSDGQIVTWDYQSGKVDFTNPDHISRYSNGCVCYAYGPLAKDNGRGDILDTIDKCASGFVRYGSAGIGLYFLLRGSISGFIGQQLRLWDCFALIPMLKARGIFLESNISEADELVDLLAFDDEVMLERFNLNALGGIA